MKHAKPPATDEANEPIHSATWEPDSEDNGADDGHVVEDPGGRVTLMLAVLSSHPGRSWHARDVARRLDVTNINSFRVQMSQWAHRGLIHKTGPATYALAC
ncbi:MULTISPECIES: hypothetical protein [Protofrankia]|uniref:MarR family transcriptional regulator n=1 Tax=Protofrankia coriariae TaxID=1562887 RepID=A0ABR5F1U1_9ACTN|nr:MULTISPECIES: hypothetical protein [Protofrankia]KLL10608.1 hypothetical protein FrCorBMG51_16475 [Protofrankia coriariae]ONH35132.1 hypothetical protein BL254_13170 [Protofrankia sp. BMG5.30]